MKLAASSLDQVYEIRSWLCDNLGKGSEVKSWYTVINDQIMYRCDDGFSWTLTYRYFGDLTVEITGVDETIETMLRLKFQG